MTIIATIIGIAGRFAGRVLTTTLGWASVLLFGRVPADRQRVLVGMTFGSIAWLALVGGILVPEVGTFLLTFLPLPAAIPTWIVRLVMLAGAILVPATIGLAARWLARESTTGSSLRHAGAVEAIVRGYPLTALLAGTLIFLAGLAIYRWIRSVARGWVDTHVGIVVSPGQYEAVAADLDAALTAAGLELEVRPAPASMSVPAHLLASVAGGQVRALLPDRLVSLHAADLDILIYPSDLLISGREPTVARARAAMATRLTTSAAHLTTSAEGQSIEDRLRALAPAPSRDDEGMAVVAPVHPELAEIDHELATLALPYDEWEILYRERLQVELAMREASPPSVPGATAAASVVADVAPVVATAVAAALDAASERAMDRLGGQWSRRAVRLVTLLATAGLSLAGRRPRPAADAALGEPLAVSQVDPDVPKVAS